MSDSPQTPPPLSATPAPPLAGGGWWFAWLLATVIIPGLALPVVDRLPNSELSVAFCWVAGAGMLILHIVAAVKLGKGRSGCMAVALTLGGWVLMLASFFVGCVSIMSNMDHR